MSDPFYTYTGGGFPGAGGDGGPPRRFSDYEVDLIASRYADVPLPNLSSADIPLHSLSSADIPLPSLSSAEVGYFDAHLGVRRSAEVLYHHSLMGSHSNVGQSEPLYSSNTMVKRPRLESSHTIYPQRPGVKACAFYMMNGKCKFGQDCRFDHPQGVLESGTPNWSEIQNVEEFKPERPGKLVCPYLVKTGECRFKSCKFNHPKDKQSLIAASEVLPTRPSEPVCSYYEKTGTCKFGAKCKFNHPKDNEVPTLTGKQTIYTAAIDAEVFNGTTDSSIPAKKHTPAAHNAKGLPIRPGEADCSFYMKTGSCMYGSICRYNHPDRPAVDAALTAPLAQGILPTPAVTAPAAVLNPVATLLPGFDIHASLIPVQPQQIIYPQRPGETVCDFYMKTGNCKYTDKCRFHHPIDRSAPHPNESWDQQTVNITLAGLPRREDAEICCFYLKSGTCRFGVQCRFDHPPPMEAIAKLKATGGKGVRKAAKLLAALRKLEGKQEENKSEGKQEENKSEGKQEENKSEGLSVVLDKP